eukprot:gene19246-21174_t
MKEANRSCATSSSGKMKESSLAKRKWWQKKKALIKKDLLTISIVGMDAYKDRVDEMVALAAKKEKTAENLKMLMKTNYRGNKLSRMENRICRRKAEVSTGRKLDEAKARHDKGREANSGAAICRIA